jgi:uncharacterized membrane protein YkvI
MNRWFRTYVVPGAVFQSVMVGGGYGTGREIVEYFTSYGALGGFLGIAVAFLSLALVLAVTFEFARCFDAYDYRHFFKTLLGPGWVAFEILMTLLFLLVLAVLAAAAGNIVQEQFGLPYIAGIALMLIVVAVLTFYGQELITRALTFWSFFLYAVFIIFAVAVLSQDNIDLANIFNNAPTQDGWFWSGVRYAMYNVAIVPLLLYITKDFRSRGEAIGSGIVAGAIAMAPALIFQLTFLTAWPAVVDEPIPVYWMIGELGSATLIIIYTIMLFGTFIETGAGLLQGINDRIDGYLQDTRSTRLSPIARATIAVGAILLSAALSLIGITTLIAKGYSAMAWGFLFVYVLPLLSIGIYRLRKTPTA